MNPRVHHSQIELHEEKTQEVDSRMSNLSNHRFLLIYIAWGVMRSIGH